jgi:hypothetical protein
VVAFKFVAWSLLTLPRQSFVYNMNSVSLRSLQTLLSSLSATATLARTAISAAVLGSLGFSEAHLDVSPSTILPPPLAAAGPGASAGAGAGAHPDLTPQRMLVDRLIASLRPTDAPTLATRIMARARGRCPAPPQPQEVHTCLLSHVHKGFFLCAAAAAAAAAAAVVVVV